MLQSVTTFAIDFIVSNILGIAVVAGASSFGALLGWLLNKYVDKDAFSAKLDAWMLKQSNIQNPAKAFKAVYHLGKGCTLYLVNLPIIGTFWNKIIEPYLIWGVDLVLKVGVWALMTTISFFKNGLMSDNTNFANQSKTDAAKANQDWR